MKCSVARSGQVRTIVALGHRPFDISFGRADGAQADGPQRTGIILGLHGAEPAHDVGGRAKPGPARRWVRRRAASDVACEAGLKRLRYVQMPSCRRTATIWPMW